MMSFNNVRVLTQSRTRNKYFGSGILFYTKQSFYDLHEEFLQEAPALRHTASRTSKHEISSVFLTPIRGAIFASWIRIRNTKTRLKYSIIGCAVKI
jgi:hypothetical protein